MKIDRIQRDDVVYYRLYAQCPKCLGQERHVNQVFWKHADCVGEMYIGNNAHFFCKGCNKTIPIVKCSYSCPNCTNDTEHLVCTCGRPSSLAIHLSLPGLYATEAGLDWFYQFVVNLKKLC